MARVAVITAPNIGYRNTGMVTVDLAFESLRRRMDTEIDASWYTLHTPETVPLRECARGVDFPFRFQPLAEHLDELRDHDAVVFWGDFLHTRHYLAQDATNRLLDFGLADDRDAARSLLNRTLLLADQPDEAPRADPQLRGNNSAQHAVRLRGQGLRSAVLTPDEAQLPGLGA